MSTLHTYLLRRASCCWHPEKTSETVSEGKAQEVLGVGRRFATCSICTHLPSFIVYLKTRQAAVTRRTVNMKLVQFWALCIARCSEQTTNWRPANRSSIPSRGERFYLSPKLPDMQPAMQCVAKALSSVVKRPGREADHSPRSSSEFKNYWSYTSTPKYALMTCTETTICNPFFIKNSRY